MRSLDIPFLNIRKKISLNYPKSATIGKGLNLERIRNSRGKRAINVQVTEGLQ